jgi:hypothetical protein
MNEVEDTGVMAKKTRRQDDTLVMVTVMGGEVVLVLEMVAVRWVICLCSGSRW